MNRTAQLALVAMVLACATSLQAGVFHDLNNDRHSVLGDQFQGQVLWVDTNTPDGRKLRGTAVRLNEHYGLTAAHLFTQNASLLSDFTVGNGSNYFSDQGETRSIADFGIHPSWDGTFSNGSADLAWIRFDSPLAGDDLSIGVTSRGETITTVGFGEPTIAGMPGMPIDGERRGFISEFDELGFPPFGVDGLYARSRFQVIQISGSLGGKASGGDSGAPGFSSSGDLDWIVAGGTIGTNYGTSTFAVRLDLYRDWIESNTAIPEPSSLFIVATLLPALVSCRRR